jgi:hypothetical protein
MQKEKFFSEKKVEKSNLKKKNLNQMVVWRKTLGQMKEIDLEWKGLEIIMRLFPQKNLHFLGKKYLHKSIWRHFLRLKEIYL